MLEIIPGILEKSWIEIEKKLDIAKSFTKSVHIDIVDGKFTSNATFLDPAPFSKYTQELFLEAHFMTDNPIQYLDSFAKAGFKRFIGQIEKMPDQAKFITKAKLLGEAGLAVDGLTDLSEIKVPFENLDWLLIMMIKAGRSRQEFNHEYLKKIESARALSNDLEIEVDGGINDKTIILAKKAGATRFSSTSFIFNVNPLTDRPWKQYDLLQEVLNRG